MAGLVLLLFLQTAAADLIKARAEIDRGDLSAAETTLRSILQGEPQNGEGHYLRGIVALELGDLDTARSSLDRAIQLQSNPILALVAQSRVYQTMGDLDRAEEVLVQASTRFPDEPLLVYQRGLLRLERRDYGAATTLLSSIPENRVPPGFWETLAKAHLESGDLPEAERAFLKVLDGNPNSVNALQALSGISLKLNDPQKAWEYIARARLEAPDSPKVVYAFAALSVQLNLISEAITALRLLLLMEPDNPDYLMTLGDAVLESVTEYPKAASYFEQYVRVRPEDPVGFAMLGYAQSGNLGYDEAEKNLLKALELSPDFTEARFFLCQNYFRQNRDADALPCLQEVLQKLPDHGKALLTLGKLHLRQRNNDEAIAVLEKAAAVLPENSEAHFNLSQAYARTGDRERAQAVLEVYQRLRDNDAKRELESRRMRYNEMRQAQPQ